MCWNFGSTPNRFEPLRLFLLVLLWPGLMEPEYHNTIFKKLCSSMNCLSTEQRETLQQWLQEVRLVSRGARWARGNIA